ncbi:MAG TPA: hypothetical protein VGW10_18170, partial [Solirubrobacteraceae bacterium]|nr:hypothetical protein [Solirubrobacteraceae bacterium]
PAPRDVSPPRAVAVGRACTRARRCTLTVAVSELEPSSGIASVRARITFRARCARRKLCTRTRTVSGRRRGDRLFLVQTPALPRGRTTVRLTATDVAGNAQSVPTIVRLRLR